MDSECDRLEVVNRLRGLRDHHTRAREFVGADLQGVDLSGFKLDFVNLAQAHLEGANLTDIRLSNVILTGAQLRGACLHGAEVNFAEATQIDLFEADASQSRWGHSNLLAAQFEGANLSSALFNHCTLDEASLENVNLTGGGIVHSTCDGASFNQARLAHLETIGSSFDRANFENAKQFFTCREIIVEILRRHIDRDIDQTKLVGAVLNMRHWCYAEWKNYLTSPDMEQYYTVGLDIFGMYPESGALQALEGGWDWRHIPLGTKPSSS